MTVFRQMDRVLLRLRPLYWSARGLIRSRTLAFFVCQRQAQLPTPDGTEIRLGGVGREDIATRLAVARGDDPREYCARLTAGHWVIYALGSSTRFSVGIRDSHEGRPRQRLPMGLLHHA